MPQTATLPTGGGAGGGFENLSTPVKLGLIGGVAGLAFFLWHRMQTGGGGGGGGGGSTDSAYGIPNTAVMLGSLQQEMLDLKGQEGADTAGLSDLISGGFGNMGSMLDAQTAAFQQGLGDLQKAVIANQNANSQSILDSISARGDLLAKLVADSSGAQQAAFKAFQDATASGLGAIAAQQNAEAAAIGALGQNVTTGQADIISQIQTLQQTTTAINSKITNPQMLFSGVNLAGIRYIWYQPPGADAGHAAVYEVTDPNKAPVGISWSQYMQESGKTYFPGVSGTPVQAGYATVVA